MSAFSTLSCATELDSNQSAISPDMALVADLLSTMKQTLQVLTSTFDSLGDQTTKVAELGPAIKISDQIYVIKAKLRIQAEEQEKRMQNVIGTLRNTIAKQVSDHLEPKIYGLVQEKIAREVEERVYQQLTIQIPQTLREQTKNHKRQIIQVQTTLHNSEARRRNFAVNSNALSEPLQPLLRPLPSVESTSTGDDVFNLELPKPSALFPQNLKKLFSLDVEAARRLVRDYGLQEESSSPVGKKPLRLQTDWKKGGGGGSREQNLNRFMAHIGVQFQMMTGNSGQSPMSPVVTSA